MKTPEEKLQAIAFIMTFSLGEQSPPILGSLTEAIDGLSDEGKEAFLALVAEVIVSTDDRTVEEIMKAKAMRFGGSHGLN